MSGTIDNPVLHIQPDPYLTNPGADGGERLPVQWFQLSLHSVNFIAASLPGWLRKRAYNGQGISLKNNCSHDSPLPYLYQV